MDTNTRITELENQVKEMRMLLDSFYASAGFDPQIAKAITGLLASSSSKTAGSATQAVNELGVSSYSVMKPPSGFIRIGSYNVPYIS